ncbi:UDP-N-acetylmuramoyl-tripeptide--D-alanyl-D-alanine ligase [bacterium]|nr:UDP-N-acetylmuramoyl-tripeptide--D-alanyl-D-alanine ligase [candidate division CSSED10-310 bacterium]
MQALSLEELAGPGLAVNTPEAGATRVTGVSIDSRTIQPGELFVALRGENQDGHRFVSQAAARGAAAALVDHQVAATIPLLVVEDTLRAMQVMAARYRRRLEVEVVGITGSHGKTTCKDMTAHVLAGQYPIHKTPRNLNGQIGMPLALFGIEPWHRIMVLEMGVSQPGEMDRLVEMGKPSIGVFLNVAPVHTEFFGSLETILAEKSRLLAGLGMGTGLINADDPLVTGVPDTICGRLVRFGMTGSAVLRADAVSLTETGTRFTLLHDGSRYAAMIPIPGRHHVANALAAIGVAIEFGISPEASIRRLAEFKPADMRMHVFNRNGIIYINDAYNAAPASMAAALAVLAEMPVTGRRAAVLGDMLELGARAAEDHRILGRDAARLGIDLLLCCGTLTEQTIDAAHEAGMSGRRARHCLGHDEAAARLAAWQQPGDAVLIKGSRGMRMEQVLALLEHIDGKENQENGRVFREC